MASTTRLVCLVETCAYRIYLFSIIILLYMSINQSLKRLISIMIIRSSIQTKINIYTHIHRYKGLS